MNIVLWILQVLLAAQFLFHGWIFVAPPAEMVEMMNAEFAPWLRIFIGVAELLAAAGLILPSLTRILPWLTPLAAAGLMIVTISATVFHLARGEIGNAIYTLVLFVLVTFVAYMRWKVKPIPPRNVA
jgi:putative oxidoreductase